MGDAEVSYRNQRISNANINKIVVQFHKAVRHFRIGLRGALEETARRAIAEHYNDPEPINLDDYAVVAHLTLVIEHKADRRKFQAPPVDRVEEKGE